MRLAGQHAVITGGGEGGVHLIPARYVAGRNQASARKPRRFLQGFAAPAEQAEGRALRGKAEGDAAADAAPGARNQRMPSIQPHAFSISCSRFRLRASWACPPR